ncbi:anaerobic C4-dicarboxylate transporter DcuC [Escherichia coli]|nr:anaerobic C4-dicarboxylate transporter DcuC [Escherichia coli]
MLRNFRSTLDTRINCPAYTKKNLTGCCWIPSASGLGLLMMATMYPVLRSVGCSKESVAAIIASGVCIDFGPAASSMIVGAEVANVDLFGFFVYEQLPVAVFIIPIIAIMHMIMLRYWDNKYAEINQEHDTQVSEIKIKQKKRKRMCLSFMLSFLLYRCVCYLCSRNFRKAFCHPV